MNDEKFIEIEKISMEISSLARAGRTVEGEAEKEEIHEDIWLLVENLNREYGQF